MVDNVTIHDHYLVMTTVGIADLKAHLSEHLHTVRDGGTILVLDRREPIARIVPVSAPELSVRPAKGNIHDISLLGPCLGTEDIVDQLLQERRDRL